MRPRLLLYRRLCHGLHAADLPRRSKATTLGATSADEGCTNCAAGKYSLGGSATECLNMNCPSGQKSVKEGSTTATDGCGECALGSYSSGDDNTNCLPQNCPAG